MMGGIHVERKNAGSEVHAARSTPAAPAYPAALEPAALYLAIAYTEGSKAIVAPDPIIDRLRELGWFRAVRPRASPAYGVGWMDCCAAAWLDLELIRRAVDADQAERFVREVLALQLAKVE